MFFIFSFEGRTFWETCADAEAAADCLEYYSGLTQILHGSYIPLPQGSFAYTRKEPLGVCAGKFVIIILIVIFDHKIKKSLNCGFLENGTEKCLENETN